MNQPPGIDAKVPLPTFFPALLLLPLLHGLALLTLPLLHRPLLLLMLPLKLLLLPGVASGPFFLLMARLQLRALGRMTRVELRAFLCMARGNLSVDVRRLSRRR